MALLSDVTGIGNIGLAGIPTTVLGTATTITGPIDINAGTIDGTVIGGSTAAAITATTLNATGGGSLTGTWANLGTVTTVDLNGGTIDGTVIGGSTAAAGSFTTGAFSGTVTADGLTVDGLPTATGDTRYEVVISENQTASAGRGGGIAFARQGDILGGIKNTLDATASNSEMSFQTRLSGTVASKMVLDASGNLLVGTTDTTIYNNAANNATDNGMVYSATDSRLDVTRYTTNASAAVASFNRTGNDGNILSFARSGTTVGSIGTISGLVTIGGSGTTGLVFDSGQIYPWNMTTNAAIDASKDLGATGARFKNLYLSTNLHQGATTPSSSSAGVLNEAVGRVTYSRGSGTGGFAHVAFINGNGTVGSIVTSSSATAYNTSSDYRLKEDDVPMTGATERVKALRPINFAWKVDGSRTDGFFAHEAQEVVPECSTGTKDAMRDEEYEVTPAVEEVRDEDGNVTTEAVAAVMGTRSVPDYQGIDQSKLVPLLTAALQEAIDKIEDLTARIEALEGA